MTQAAPEVVKWLHSIGVQFNTCGYDELDLRNFGDRKRNGQRLQRVIPENRS